ncbi:MAG TPA: hypothetical protein VGN88_05765 [Phycisphaerae bacterium]
MKKGDLEVQVTPEDAGAVKVREEMPAGSVLAGGGLPRSHVLGYITGGVTPTRVRRVAGFCLMVMGAIHFVLGIGMGMLIGYEVWREISWRPISPDEILRALEYQFRWEMGPLPFLFLAIGFLAGPILLVLAWPVRRGHSIGSQLAMIVVAAELALAGLATAICGGAALVWGIDFTGRPEREKLWWLLVVPVGILVVLLLKDLCGYLKWISRNPITEKPAVAFMGKAKGAGGAAEELRKEVMR